MSVKLPTSASMLLLGFFSGLPLALSSGTLQAWMTVENLSLQQIGFATLIGQAYVFKFLWAPLLDRYAPMALDRRRGWLLSFQLLISGCLGIMALLSPAQALTPLVLAALGVAFFSASQDIVFDAYRSDTLQAQERGLGAALSVLGYRLAMLVSGGLALWLADHYLGWQGMYGLMAGLMLLGPVVTFFSAPPEHAQIQPKSLTEAIVKPFREFFQRPGCWALLTLIIFYKMGDAFAGALSTTFLIRGAGFSAGDVGLVNKTLGLLATIVGALWGGLWMKKLGLYRSLMLFGVLQALSNLMYALVALQPQQLALMATAVGIENLCGGMGTAAFVALLMSLVDSRFSATQFALLSALASVGRVYVGPATAYLVEALGWAPFFMLTMTFALPGLLLLWWLKPLVQGRDT